ncbi:MAG: ferric-dicitrate binding protein FerR (iron transport regulator) [Verrucomicrobiales bacterium]|jgi:ferric-dicitrate binding protein FerR (iron transport regulator)
MTDEILDLMTRQLEGSASAEQSKRFAQQLLASAEVRLAWLDFCRQATALSEIRISSPQAKRSLRPWILSAGLASAAAALILLFALSNSVPEPDSTELTSWQMAEEPVFLGTGRQPDFATWSLADFALVATDFPTLTHEKFWSGTPATGFSLLTSQTNKIP